MKNTNELELKLYKYGFHDFQVDVLKKGKLLQASTGTYKVNLKTHELTYINTSNKKRVEKL